MRKSTQDKLRAEWHGPFSAEHIARRHHLPVGTVRNFWTAEKKAGRLPDLPCRPAFAANNPPPEPIMPAEPETDFDDCDQVFGTVEDLLLARLTAAHGDDPRRRVERDTADILEGVEGEYDRAVMRDGRPDRTWFVPLRMFLAGIVRNYDAAMRRFAKHSTRET